MKKIMRNSRGFTIVEILVVVAILGVLSVVVGVNIGKYMGQGKTEAYATELHDIRTAVAAMLIDSSAGQLDSAHNDINDMDLVTADSGALVLSNYLKNLGEDGMILTGCDYSFTINGTVTQKTP